MHSLSNQVIQAARAFGAAVNSYYLIESEIVACERRAKHLREFALNEARVEILAKHKALRDAEQAAT